MGNEKRNAVTELMEQGKAKGKLTTKEITDFFLKKWTLTGNRLKNSMTLWKALISRSWKTLFRNRY